MMQGWRVKSTHDKKTTAITNIIDIGEILNVYMLSIKIVKIGNLTNIFFYCYLHIERFPSTTYCF